MKLTYAELSSTGPVRDHNEDFLLFWQPEDEQERMDRGGIALLADGVGGHGAGEVAAELAVHTALKTFQEAGTTTGNQLLWRLFNAANVAVYDAGVHEGGAARMATTLTVAVFRRNELAIGHVGDSRAYLIRQGTIRLLTADHTYVAMQLKLRLISQQEAATSDLRTMLTRSIGQNPTVQVDYNRLALRNADTVVLCSDGLHAALTDAEIQEGVNRMSPQSACEHLVRLAEKRGSQDNISVQVVRVDDVPSVGYYRGRIAYHALPSQPVAAELQVGQVLDERFELTELINRSAMSSVFKATDLKTGHQVGVKVPLAMLEADPAAFSRFQREGEIGREMDHPSILKIVPMDAAEQSRPYLVMEYLDGQTLERLMQEVRPLPEADGLRIMRQVCDAVDYLHKHGVVHRDLKPQNIMLCSDGSVRIMDFGIAKAASSRRITFGTFSPTMGTPDYMAPEQVKGQRGDERTDVYSLGAILYEMLTGRVPFEGQTAYIVMNARLLGDPVAPRDHNPDIRPEVEEIILHALAREPRDRYQSAGNMKAEIDAPERVVVEGRVSRLTAAVPWKSRWRTVRNVVLIALVPIALFFLFFLLLSRRR